MSLLVPVVMLLRIGVSRILCENKSPLHAAVLRLLSTAHRRIPVESIHVPASELMVNCAVLACMLSMHDNRINTGPAKPEAAEKVFFDAEASGYARVDTSSKTTGAVQADTNDYADGE